MWFWIIIATGAFVATSQFHESLISLGSVAAGLLGIISIIAVLFGLIAATIGGSFKLDGRESLLLFSFFLIAVFGFTLIRINKNQHSHELSIGKTPENITEPDSSSGYVLLIVIILLIVYSLFN